MYNENAPKGKTIQTWPAVLTVLGGDARQAAVACRLAERVCTVRMFATGEGSVPTNVGLPVCACHSLWEAWSGSRVMILPLPVTRDGETVWCPLAPDCAVSLRELARAVGYVAGDHARPLIFGGRVPPAWREALEAAGGVVFDYFDREDVQVRNAYITAEGAVMTAMELMDITLQAAPVAVLGYGRIGQLLTRILLALGGKVTVFARRPESRAWALADGANAVDTVELADAVENYAAVFNTVPAHLLNEKVVGNMDKKAVVIDLASSPGGLTPEAERMASARGWPRVVHALSLPGRYAPVTAGEVIADGIWDEIKKEGET